MSDKKWVVVGHNKFECLYCGVEMPIAMPIKLSKFIEAGDEFLAEHSNCKLWQVTDARETPPRIHITSKAEAYRLSTSHPSVWIKPVE